MYIGFLEDEPELSQHVCEILESAGHSVALFNNGQDMIRAIGRDTMDLFVLDWRVPRVITGIEVLKHIRLVKGLKEPVLFLTSKSDEPVSMSFSARSLAMRGSAVRRVRLICVPCTRKCTT